eukprot:TRINITY_DN8004_c0_g1_i1.p1 TRINITY_DN8004_c0_g1~~TRINITY_DN8004_c0_g1_i1.p1  ORF type:complete len:1361 (+),score=272.64 TRINITY_DN8004_c0_g1_i1:72-4154(+)
MLKIQLASKNILKAVHAKEAEWGKKILASVSEWDQLGDILTESTRSSGGTNVDDNVIVGMSKALSQCDPSSSSSLQSSLARVLQTLNELYSDNIYAIPVMSELVLAVLNKTDDTLQQSGLNWYTTALGAHHKVQLKTAYDQCLQNDGELLHKLIGSRNPTALAAVVFSTAQDWKTFLNVRDSEEAVNSIIESLPKWKTVSDGLPKTQTKDNAASGLSKMNFLFLRLSENSDSISECHLLVDAFLLSSNKMSTGEVGSEYSRELMKLFLLLAVTVLKCEKSDANTKVRSVLRIVKSVSGCYHSQTDVLYHFGFGFRVLSHVTKELLSFTNDINSDAVIECGHILHSMYHKITEPYHKEFLALSLTPPKKYKNNKRDLVAQTFVSSLLESYTQMQSLDQVVGSLCDNDTLFKESDPPKWFNPMLQSYIPKMLDAMPTAKVVLGYVCRYGDYKNSIKSRCVPTLSTVAAGLPINETSAVSSVLWLDSLVNFAYSILAEMLSGAKNSNTLTSCLHLYWSAQQVLDSAAGYFFMTDIFKWSEKSTVAFTLAAKPPHKEDSNPDEIPALPLVFFTECATTYTIPEILSFAGDKPTRSVEAVVVRLIHQRLMRIIQHYEIQRCSSNAEGKEEQKTISRMKKQIKRLTAVMIEMWSSLLKSSQKESADTQIDVNEVPTNENAAASVTVVLAPDFGRFSEYCDDESLVAVVKYLITTSSDTSVNVMATSHDQSTEETLWKCRSLFDEFEGAISQSQARTPRSAAADVICCSETFESSKLTTAIVAAATQLLTSATSPSDIATATAWVLRVPVDVLPFIDTTHLLPAIADAEAKAKKIKIKAMLRTALSHLCRRSPGWCSDYGKELKRLLSDCCGGKESILAIPTMRLSMEVINGSERTEELCLDILNHQQVGKLVARQLIPAVILQKLSPSEHPYTLAEEVADIRKKSKKRGRKSDDTNENYEAIEKHLNVDNNSSNLEIGIKLLLLRRGRVICSELSKAVLQIVLTRFQGGSAPTESLLWLTAITLDSVLPALAGGGSKTNERIAAEFITAVIQKATRTAEAEAEWNLRFTSSSTTLLSLVTPKISLLPNTRIKVLSSVFSECRQIIEGKVPGVSISGPCSVLSSLLINCPSEVMSDLKSLHEVLMSALVKFHSCLLSSNQNDVRNCPSLGSLVAVICLVEKVVLPASAIPIILSLPANILRDTKQGVDFSLRFAVADNILRNLLLHRAGSISGHWGEYVHAVSDLIDAFLKSEDPSPQPDTEGICSIVRLLELLAGSKKRVGMSDSVRETIGHHGTTLLHRFLNSVVSYPGSANANNRELARGFNCIMSLCGKQVFSTAYANMPQSYRIVASSFHVQWQATRFQGKT